MGGTSTRANTLGARYYPHLILSWLCRCGGLNPEQLENQNLVQEHAHLHGQDHNSLSLNRPVASEI